MKKYEAFAPPFAFLIDEKGIVASRGIVVSKEHLGYVRSGEGHAENQPPAIKPAAAEEDVSRSVPYLEVQHV